MAITYDWGTWADNKIITGENLNDAITLGTFTGAYTYNKKTINKSELIASTVNYDPYISTFIIKTSLQLLAKRDIVPLPSITTRFNNTVYSTIKQSDNKLISVGDFTTYNGSSTIRITRLNQNGSIDTSFSSGSGFNDFATSSIVQSDGKIIVTGKFSSYNGSSKNGIVRLNSDGSIDSSFAIGAGLGTSGIGFAILKRSDDKIIVVGSFLSYDSTPSVNIASLNTDGSIDLSFFAGSGFNGNVFCVAQQSDGKIVVGGTFSSYKSTTIYGIARLNLNGSIDTSFSTGSGINYLVYSVIQQSDGKLLLGGNFSLYNGVSKNNIVRLNSDGSIDSSFNIGTGFNDEVRCCIQQSDGKIVVVGLFTSYNGASKNKIIRLNSDGSVDSTFNVSSGFNFSPLNVIQESDGKLIVSGIFTSYNGVTKERVVRLNSDGSIALGI